MIVLGAVLLVLSGFFAYSAEFPADRFPLLGRIEAAFPAIHLGALFDPVVSAAIVTVPTLLLAILYFRPPRRTLLLALLAGVVSLTPVVPGVTSWMLYMACAMAGAVLVARGIDVKRIPQLGTWRTFVIAACAIHLVLTIAIAYGFFGGVPHVMDSVAQRFHAKMFAAGHVAAPAPPVPDAFDYTHMVIRDGRWYSAYFPAHPFIVSLFVRAGIAPLANPVIGVIALLGTAVLARMVAGERAAKLTVVLLLISPWWLLMHAEGMNHATANAALVWALVFFVRATRGESWLALASGLLFGVAFLVRPYTPLLIGAALVVYALVQRDWKWLRATALVAVGALPAVLLMLRFDQLTTGSPFLTAYVAKLGKGIAPGFHQPPYGPPHTPLLGVRNVLADLNALNRWMLGVAIPPVVLLAGARRSWLWLVPLSLLIGHFTYWYVDFCFGPRFLFEALPALAILAALAILELWSRAPQRVAALCAVSLLAAPAIWLGLYQNYGRAYYGVDDRAASRVVAQVPPDALVFVPPDQYGAYVWRNDPWLKRGPVYARDRGEANAEVIRAFPNRKVVHAASFR